MDAPTLIQLNHWIGGIGNNLEQIVNAYWLAKKCNGKFICNVDHHLLTAPDDIQFGPDILQKQLGCFTNVELHRKKIDVAHERFVEYPEILQKLSSNLFNKIPKKSFDGIVVHVRAGNIFRDPSCGRNLIQAPIKYFDKVIKTLKITNDILVVTGTKHKRDVNRYPNPITAEIQEYCKRAGMTCHVHNSSDVEAAGYLLGAKHAMLTGYTTFSRMLLLANSDLKTVIIPSMGSWPHDEISFKQHKCKIHYFDILNYLGEGEWLAPNVSRQITHPIGKIRYRR